MKTGFRSFSHFVIMAALICQSHIAGKTDENSSGNRSPEQVGQLIAKNLLARDYMFYGEYGLHYAESCAAVGALKFGALVHDQALVDSLIQRYTALLDNSSPLISRRAHVDQNVTGILPLQIAIQSGDERFLKQGLTFADSQWDSTIDQGLTFETRWWIDDLYMIGMLQMQAYRATGNPVYADRAARQFAAYLPRLQQENGLFYHGIDSPHFWGRGNGWVAASMTEVLISLPENHEYYPQILKHYMKMMAVLAHYQSDNGMWRQLVDYPYAWAESSCTAMFAYAMAAGVNHGWLDDSYMPGVIKAWHALAAHVNQNGDLREICVGTGQQDDIEYYLNRPRHAGDLHGQAPMLWLIDELIRPDSKFRNKI